MFNFDFLNSFIQGGVTENFEFTINEDTEVYHSCSATLNGEVFVFGGSNTSNNRRKQVSLVTNENFENILLFQVSKIVGCELRRIGDLNSDFVQGACGTYNFHEERVLLCFSDTDKTGCERFVIF